MKTIITLCLVCFFTQTLSAQNQKKTLYGSFVLENHVFQYQYKRNGNIHSLKLSSLEKPDATSGLDSIKLDKTLDFIKSATVADSTKKFYPGATQGIIDTIAQ